MGLALGGCDFQAAEDALSSAEVVVGAADLPAGAAVQVLDAQSQKAITSEVTVQFEGPSAGEVQDVYGSPVSEIQMTGGFGAFGLTRPVAPDNPARLTLRASAEGYESLSQAVAVSDPEGEAFVLRLKPEDPRRAPEGTAGDRAGGTAGADGSVQNPIRALAQVRRASGGSGAEAALQVPSGAALSGPDGEAISGPVTADLSAYGASPAALRILPSELLRKEGGGRRQIRGAVGLEIAGEDGRTASQVSPSSTDTTAVEAELPELEDQASTVTFANPASGSTRVASLSGGPATSEYASSKNVLGGRPRPMASGRKAVTIQILGDTARVKGPSGRVATVSLAGLGGRLLAAVAGSPDRTCVPGGTIVLEKNRSRSGTARLQIEGEGFFESKEVSLPRGQGAAEVDMAALFDGPVPSGSEPTIRVRTPGGQERSKTTNICSGRSTISLPKASSRTDASIRITAGCPAGERLPVTPPIDGYGVSYRQAGSGRAYSPVAREQIQVDTTGSSPVKITGATVEFSGVAPGEEYDVTGYFGSESASKVLTMPPRGTKDTVVARGLREQCR